MAQVTQRVWKSGPRQVKRCAWGFTAQRDGRQVRRFREDWTKEDAERAFSEWTLGVAPPPPPVAGITLGEILDTFVQHRKASPKNKSAQDDEERSRPLRAFFGATTPLAAITTKLVAEYRMHRGRVTSRLGRLLSPTTVNRECQVLRGAMNLAHEWEEITTVPRFKMAAEQPRERWLTEDEITRLLAACAQSKSPMLAPIVRTGIHTGLRQGELLSLEWANIDFTRCVIALPARRTKSAKARTIPLNRDVYDALAPLRSDAGGQDARGRVWGAVRDVDTAFRVAVKRAGLAADDREQRVTFHTLRHTFASHFAQRTGDLVKLQQILGHASIRTTQDTYAHFAPDHVQGATAVLEGLGASRISAPSTHEAPESPKRVATAAQVCESQRTEG
jgi:integrase